MFMSILQQPLMSSDIESFAKIDSISLLWWLWTRLFYSRLRCLQQPISCLCTCLFYTVKQPVLPGRVRSTAAYTASARVCSSVLQQTVLLPNVFVLQQSVQPLDVLLFYCSLCCPWTCLFYCSLFCPWTCLFYRSLCPRVCSTAVCAASECGCPTAACAASGRESVPLQPVLPLDLSILL